MTLPQVTGANYPTQDEILSQFLADIRYAYAQVGVTVNVEPYSELWLRGKAYAARVSVAIANNQLAQAATSPLTATGADLDTLAGLFGVTRRPAVASAGYVTVATQRLSTGGYATVTIPSNFAWTSAGGVKCQATAATVTNGDTVELRSTTLGATTALAEGTVGQWDSASIGYLVQQANVAAGGITGGHDADDDETLRTRLLRKLSRPAVGGNSAHVQELAEGASSAIAAAYVYQAVRGPASYDVALVAADGDRTVNATVVADVEAALLEMPGSADANVTTVFPEEVDAVCDLKLPMPITAGGAGGGWLDTTPWPSDAETSPNVFGRVTSIADIANSRITVNSTSADAPTVGNHIAIWDPDGLFNHFTIAGRSGGSGAYVLTLSPAAGSTLSTIAVGQHCSPDATHLDDYGAAFLAAMLALGPGEKTDSADILPRGRRSPGTDTAEPSDVDLSPVVAVANVGAEVMGCALQTFTTGTYTAQTSPSLPATTLLAPRILVLANLSFRRKT